MKVLTASRFAVSKGKVLDWIDTIHRGDKQSKQSSYFSAVSHSSLVFVQADTGSAERVLMKEGVEKHSPF